MRIWPVAAGWVLTRAMVLVLLHTQENWVAGDVQYYWESLGRLGEFHVGGTLVEYPVPAVILLWLPYAALNAAGQVSSYATLIEILAVLTDLAFLAFLVHARRWRAWQRYWLGITPAEWAWLLAVPALGATAYARFDLFPGIMVGLAMLYAVRRPAVAAGFGALATGVKYWPALVLPVLGAPREGRRRVLLTLGICGALLALGSLVLGSWHRLLTPLHYQNDRGLQIESVAATPAMLSWSERRPDYTVGYTMWRAYDVSGPTVDFLLRLATIASLVVLGVMAVLWAVAWLRMRERGPAVEPLVWLVLASVTGFMVTSKVLSPQYFLWLLPAAAAGLLLLAEREAFGRLAVWTGLLLAVVLITHEIFPRHYLALTGHWGDTRGTVVLLAVRNLLLLALFLYAAGRAARLVLRFRPMPERAAVPEPELVDD